MDYVKKPDFDIVELVAKEEKRQEYELNLIASENIVSPAVMQMQGSVLTNKYAEGYPGKRYYGGCVFADEIEKIAIKRAKKLFGAEYANVQAHSGSQANMAVYFAMLKPGDRILAMDLSHGGHLTHGSPVSFSGKIYHFAHYGLSQQTERIDLNQVEDLSRKHRPKLIVAGASAYPRIIDFKGFSQIAKSVGAWLMVDMAHISGLVAGGVHPNPIGYADIVTSTTHKTLRGPRGGMILANQSFAKSIGSQIFPGIQGGPLLHVIAAKAVAFKEALDPSFSVYQQQVIKNTSTLAEVMMERGFKLVSDGTDNHMVLVDFSKYGISGKEAEERLGRAGITVNKNTVPNEKRGPFVTSGIRVGMPLVTSRGMKEDESIRIANYICDVLDSEKNVPIVAAKTKKLCMQYPISRHPERKKDKIEDPISRDQ